MLSNLALLTFLKVSPSIRVLKRRFLIAQTDNGSVVIGFRRNRAQTLALIAKYFTIGQPGGNSNAAGSLGVFRLNEFLEVVNKVIASMQNAVKDKDLHLCDVMRNKKDDSIKFSNGQRL